MSHVQRFADGLDLIHQVSFDVVLLDLSLPDAQGLASLSQICHFVPELPVIVLTREDNPNTAVEALRLGAQDYLVKGRIDGDLLVRSLRYAIERHRAQGALRESQERCELAARAANDGLWDWDLRTNRVYYSPRWCLMLGYSEEELGDSPTEWFHRLHPDDVEPTRRAITRHFKGETDHFEQEYRIRHRSGSYRWMLSRGMALYTENGIHPNTLRLEITEGTILREITGINRKLADLRKLNVRLYIDDFGTGYSSLSSLHYYPINTLKIDGSFIANMNSESGNIDIVRTIISLAHDLNLDVIAEGVETAHQMSQLQALNCEFGQGVLFAQAGDPVSSRTLLQQNPSWLSSVH
jgi:PAS domain S-box-containing protein